MLLLFITLSAESSDKQQAKPEKKTVKVAAIQAATKIGKIKGNCAVLIKLITAAAKHGAKIIVLPECALQGYMDPENDIIWAKNANPADNELPIEKGAVAVNSPLINYFAKLAAKLKIYLCLPFAEKCDKTLPGTKKKKTFYYNAQVLFNPEGKIIAHHRKRNLWPPGDGGWVSEGNLPAQVVKTEYGRLGMMICFDLHLLPTELAKKKADIVLYSVGWYGPNEKNWFHNRFPRDYVKPYHYSLILANWAASKNDEGWVGIGYSTIYNSKGKILNTTEKTKGSTVIYAEIPYK